MVMAWDAAHILLAASAASAAAAVAIVATSVTLARAIIAAFVLEGALLGASGVNFAFNTP